MATLAVLTLTLMVLVAVAGGIRWGLTTVGQLGELLSQAASDTIPAQIILYTVVTAGGPVKSRSRQAPP